MIIPEICQRDSITSFRFTMGFSKKGMMPPIANGPSNTPAKTNPTISEILKCLQIFRFIYYKDTKDIIDKDKRNVGNILEEIR